MRVYILISFMLLKSLVVPKQLRGRFLPLFFPKTKKFYTCLSSPVASCLNQASTSQAYSNWVYDNELFQRHPRLRLLEGQCKSFHQLKQVLSYVFLSGLHRNPFVMSRILYLCLITLEGDIEMKSRFGVRIFGQIDEPNTFSWNTMIRFFAVYGHSRNALIALSYYVKMLRQEQFPDKYTFPFLLQACGSNSDLGLVKQVHCHVLTLGFDHDLFVQNSILYAFFVCGSFCDAREVFEEMTEKDVVSWTTLLSGLITQACYHEALYVFSRMRVDECQPRPNVATMVSVISACGNLGSLDHTKCLHALLEKAGWVESDVSIGNSLIDAYAKSGSINNAFKVFNEMPNIQRDVYSWTAMISGFAMHGRGLDATTLFLQMKQAPRMVPDAITFIAVLSACAHSGQVEEGLWIFESMKIEYAIEPELKHYGCMVDLLGRAGILEGAYSLVERMPMEPNLPILGSLLSACRLHRNVTLGEAVVKKIELLSESGGGAPVLLSNIYANEKQWAKVVRVRRKMRGQMQEKPPGRSWIQVKDVVHEFVVGETSHPQAMELYMVLEGLERLTKML